MEKPDFLDAVYESFFSGGYASAAKSGTLDEDLYHKYETFFLSMDQGAPLVAWCHFIDTYFGGREKLIDNLDDDSLAPIVRLLFYVRNAFIHCGWDVSNLDFPNQQKRIREFCDSGGTCTSAPGFKLTIDEENLLHVDGLMGACMTIGRSVRSPTKSA